MNDEERPIVTRANENRVRAGVTGHNVRYVLFASVAILVAGFIALYVFTQ